MFPLSMEELHTYHRDFKPGTTLPSGNSGVKGEDIDDPVPVQLKAGPAPRFSTGKVSGVLDDARLSDML